MASDTWRCHCPLCWISTPPTFQCRGGASDGCNNVLYFVRVVSCWSRGGLGGSSTCSRRGVLPVLGMRRARSAAWTSNALGTNGVQCREQAGPVVKWQGREDKVWMKASLPYQSTNPTARCPFRQRVRRRARERFQLKMQETTADRNIRFEYWWDGTLQGLGPSGINEINGSNAPALIIDVCFCPLLRLVTSLLLCRFVGHSC